MKTRLCVGMAALLCAGYAQATCGPIMVTAAPALAELVVDQPLVDFAAPLWQADKVYQKGEVVLHTKGLYQARWWTQNEEPGPTWASWERVKRDYDQWSNDTVYNQGNLVLHAGKAYQAQYWTQGHNPFNGTPWLETESSKKLLAAEFIQESYDCGTPPHMNPDGSYYYTRHYVRSISLATEITDEVIFDTVRFSSNYTGKIEPITAVIDGQTCQGQAACNALLNGEEKQVSYYSIATKSWSKTYGSVMPTPTPIPTPLPTPVVGFVQAVADDEATSRTVPQPTVAPTPYPTPIPKVLVCNTEDICRQVNIDL